MFQPVDDGAAGIPEPEVSPPAQGAVAAAAASPFATLYANFEAMLDNHVRIPGHPAWIVLCGYNMGETSAFCALAKSFAETHGHGIILVVRPSHVSVAKMWAHRFLKVVIMPDDTMRAMLRSGYIPQDRFELNQPMSACWIDRGFRYSDGIKYLTTSYAGRGGISETDLQRFVLHVPWDAPLEPPRILPEWEQQAMRMALEHGLRLGRSVLLCPINNSADRYSQLFWNAVAERLVQQGYKVFTNMGGLNAHNGLEQMPIPGTTGVNLPVELVIPFIHLAGRVITGGNGMSFLTMLANWKTFKMTQLLPTPADGKLSHSSLGVRARSPSREWSTISATQYYAPELCLDTPMNEFLITFDAPDDEQLRLARVVADQDTRDPSCIVRREKDGTLFIDEHADWLQGLALPPT